MCTETLVVAEFSLIPFSEHVGKLILGWAFKTLLFMPAWINTIVFYILQDVGNTNYKIAPIRFSDIFRKW